MRFIQILSTNFKRLLRVACIGTLALLAACAGSQPPIVMHRAQPVPYPPRPDFVRMENGDLAPMQAPARERLAQRHTQVVWYLRELENALQVYDAQTLPKAIEE